MLKNVPLTDKNKKTWTANLMRFQYGKTSRRHTTVKGLSQMSKTPKEQHILDRYKTLASGLKSKKKRTLILAGEVRQLWKNLSLPIQQGKPTVERKIEDVIKQYERNSRRPENYDFTKLFNVTDLFIYAYELMLCLHVFRQTGPPRRVDCLAPPSVCHIKTEASR